MSYWPVKKTTSRFAIKEPVLHVGKDGRAHMSISGEVTLGSPDAVVLMRGRDGNLALRAARLDDPITESRTLSPDGNLRLPRWMESGHYELVPTETDGLFRLEPRATAQLTRVVITTRYGDEGRREKVRREIRGE